MRHDQRNINNVIGNTRYSDDSAGYKSEVKHIFESYANQGVNLSAVNDLSNIISSPSARDEFISNVVESVVESPITTNPLAANSPFYMNYAEKMEQLLENSLKSVATESALIGYAPIVAYNPFFIKKQWIESVFKDVLMTEIPTSPVINLAFERRYLKTMAGEEHELPHALYDDELMKSLMAEATGNAIKEDPIDLSDFKPALSLIDSNYIPGIITGDTTVELTPDIHIFKVTMVDKDDSDKEYEVPVYIKTDITTHNFIKGKVKYEVKDDISGALIRTLEDEIVGNVNFQEGKVIIMSTNDVISKVCLRGKIANRFNNRSLDVVRRNEQIQHVMPESGPRLNSSITVEDAADALALQNIDVIADNVDIMGRTLANFEDADIKMFLERSFDAQKTAGVGPFGYESMIVESEFNAKPYEQYNGRISEWMKDSREYFERTIAGLKTKLKTEDAIIVAVAHPNIIRFLQDGINWVFTDDTQISGMKISYKFGILTSAQDRVHVITSMRMKEDDGIRFVVIPLTQELVTFKHYKYNMIIDRGYRNPVYTLTPNIMVTHRTLTFEVLPVQGKMVINGRDLFSPETLKRP